VSILGKEGRIFIHTKVLYIQLIKVFSKFPLDMDMGISLYSHAL
jgi:hypothetical protein